MHPLAAALLKIAKPIVLKKVTEEVTERVGEYVEVKTKEVEVIDKKKTTAKTTAILSIVTAVLYGLSAYGVITPEIANVLNAIMSNPDTAKAIGEAVN